MEKVKSFLLLEYGGGDVEKIELPNANIKIEYGMDESNGIDRPYTDRTPNGRKRGVITFESHPGMPLDGRTDLVGYQFIERPNQND